MTPQSVLCNCSRKWKAKLIVPIYFRTKTSEFCLRIISFSSLESDLSFDSKDSEINFDRARSTTVKSLLGALRAIFEATTPKTFLWTSCLCIRNGKLDTKWRMRKTKIRKENSRTVLDGKLITKHKVPTSVYSLQLSLARMYFVKVWLFQFVIYFLECFMFIRAKYVLQCSRCDDLQNPGCHSLIWAIRGRAAG